MSAYAELLRDPRWQKKRLDVLNRDGFACIKCGNSKVELHVHHTFYDGRKPWEYELSALETLCKLCHQKHHGNPVLTVESRKEIIDLIEKIANMRALIPDTWYPNTGWIEERLDVLLIELNEKLNNEDHNG